MTTTPEHPGSWPADDFVSTEELIRRHHTRPVATIDGLPADEDPFESDAEHDEFLADLYASRRVDLG